MSLSADFPAMRPTLLLNFARARQLDPRITFTRASTATYFDSSGVLQTAIAGQPRFDFNPTTGESLGLLIEEQRTNLLVQSGWAGATTGTPGAAPTSWTTGFGSGTETTLVNSIYGSGDLAQAIRFDADSGERIYFNQVINVSDGVTYTLSVYVEDVSGNVGRVLSVVSGTASANITVNPNTPTGPERQYLVFTAVGTGTINIRCGIGTTAPIVETASLILSRPQVEEGTFPTSYIPTTTTAVTRNAEVATMTGTNFSSWYNADEGSLFIDLNFYALQSFKQGVNFSNSGDTTNFMSIQTATSPAARGNVFTNGTSQAAMFPGNLTAGVDSKLCFAYKVNDFAITLNGAAVATDTSGTVPVVNQLGIGTTGSITSNGNQTIRKIAYYPVRLSNAQLQALTS